MKVELFVDVFLPTYWWVSSLTGKVKGLRLVDEAICDLVCLPLNSLLSSRIGPLALLCADQVSRIPLFVFDVPSDIRTAGINIFFFHFRVLLKFLLIRKSFLDRPV